MLDGVLKAVFLQFIKAPHLVSDLIEVPEIAASLNKLPDDQKSDYLNSVVNELMRKELIVQ